MKPGGIGGILQPENPEEAELMKRYKHAAGSTMTLKEVVALAESGAINILDARRLAALREWQARNDEAIGWCRFMMGFLGQYHFQPSDALTEDRVVEAEAVFTDAVQTLGSLSLYESD